MAYIAVENCVKSAVENFVKIALVANCSWKLVEYFSDWELVENYNWKSVENYTAQTSKLVAF